MNLELEFINVRVNSEQWYNRVGKSRIFVSFLSHTNFATSRFKGNLHAGHRLSHVSA